MGLHVRDTLALRATHVGRELLLLGREDCPKDSGLRATPDVAVRDKRKE